MVAVITLQSSAPLQWVYTENNTESQNIADQIAIHLERYTLEEVYEQKQVEELNYILMYIWEHQNCLHIESISK